MDILRLMTSGHSPGKVDNQDATYCVAGKAAVTAEKPMHPWRLTELEFGQFRMHQNGDGNNIMHLKLNLQA